MLSLLTVVQTWKAFNASRFRGVSMSHKRYGAVRGRIKVLTTLSYQLITQHEVRFPRTHHFPRQVSEPGTHLSQQPARKYTCGSKSPHSSQ